MPTITFKRPEKGMTIDQLANLLAIVTKELEWLVSGNLDVNNIRAHSITAETLNVDELSAITANLGTITAGIINGIQIFGSYIATSNGTFPRCEMSASGNVFSAYFDADNYISIEPDYAGSPSLNFTQGGTLKGRLDTLLGNLEIFCSDGIEINGGGTSGTVRIDGNATFDSFSKVKSASPATDLQTALNAKANTFSGVTGTVYVASSSGGSPTTAITFTNGVRTS